MQSEILVLWADVNTKCHQFYENQFMGLQGSTV